jgi:hypothetical protein
VQRRRGILHTARHPSLYKRLAIATVPNEGLPPRSSRTEQQPRSCIMSCISASNLPWAADDSNVVNVSGSGDNGAICVALQQQPACRRPPFGTWTECRRCSNACDTPCGVCDRRPMLRCVRSSACAPDVLHVRGDVVLPLPAIHCDVLAGIAHRYVAYDPVP